MPNRHGASKDRPSTTADEPPATTLRSARWPDDEKEVGRLFAEYRQWIADHGDPAPAAEQRVKAGLGLVDRLVREMPRIYAPPHGDVLLWFRRNQLVACGALREIEPRTGEIRRVFIRADFRGGTFGRPFVLALLARSRELGFERVRADVLGSMPGAIEFYEELGFRRTNAFWPHPASDAVFFERDVDPKAGAPGEGR